MSTIRKYRALTPELQGLAIELAITRARQDQYADLTQVVTNAVIAAGAALSVGETAPELTAEANVDPAKPGSETTVTATFGIKPDAPNPVQNGAALFDELKTGDDALDALSFVLRAMLGGEKKEHCGNPECNGCNEHFGPVTTPAKPKLQLKKLDAEAYQFNRDDWTAVAFKYIDNSVNGIAIFRSVKEPNRYALIRSDEGTEGKIAFIHCESPVDHFDVGTLDKFVQNGGYPLA